MLGGFRGVAVVTGDANFLCVVKGEPYEWRVCCKLSNYSLVLLTDRCL